MTDCDRLTAMVTDYPVLDNSVSVTTTTIDSKHYALVASAGIQDDDGVQIIDITTPSSPTAAVADVTDCIINGHGVTDYDGA